MKLSKLFAGIFGLMGLALALACVWLSLNFREASPVLLAPADAAQKTTQAMMEEVCSGDYKAASARILGNPDFGFDKFPEDPVEAIVWNRFMGSFSYELLGDCYATESGVAQKIRLTYLNLDSVTQNLRERTQTLMEERIEAATDMDQIYDENHEFIEAFVMQALRDAAQTAVHEDAEETFVEFTANLIYREGQWWILPDAALMAALSGGIVK